MKSSLSKISDLVSRYNFFLLLFLSGQFTMDGQVYSDFLGAGHSDGISISASHQESPATNTLNGSGLGHNLAQTSRFLSHATMGSNLNDIRALDQEDYEQWIADQASLPASSYLEYVDEITAHLNLLLGDQGREVEVTAQLFRAAWWNIVMNKPDFLRHKVALALSELLVISDQSDLIILGRGMASYYDILARNAFGNYRDILMEVSLHPTMGFYLSHLNNPKTDLANNIHPDENYAREVMQLFSIGLVELNLDGTTKLDNMGLEIPTYDNEDIRELAKVFTGLSGAGWAVPEIALEVEFGHPIFYYDVTKPMKMYEEHHEVGTKTIVGDFTIPAGQTGIEDVEMTINHLFNHPNVAPFISKHLIQRLIKSNPSHEYVQRIAQVFEDNGSGVRGDLEAVIKALLLDLEARDDAFREDFDSGRLREPLLRYTHFLKAFEAEAVAPYFLNGGYLYQNFTGQAPLSSPTVFNFFLPGYQPNGEIADYNLVAPEFQILNSATSVGYVNMLAIWLFGDLLNEVPEFLEDNPLYKAKIMMEEWAYLGDHPKALIDFLDLLLAHGNLSEDTRQIVFENIEPVPVQEIRIALAIYLIMLSPDYVIMK